MPPSACSARWITKEKLFSARRPRHCETIPHRAVAQYRHGGQTVPLVFPLNWHPAVELLCDLPLISPQLASLLQEVRKTRIFIAFCDDLMNLTHKRSGQADWKCL